MRIRCFWMLAAAAALVSGSPGATAETVRTGSLPDLEPGFTTSARQALTLEVGGLDAPIRIVDVSVNDRAVPQGTWKATPERITITPDQDLRVGLNRITLRYAGDANPAAGTPAELNYLINYQPKRLQVAFGDRGELIVDGARHFVRAGYRSGQFDGLVAALPSAADAGFDMVHDYRFETMDVEKIGVPEYIQQARAYLRKAEQLGLGVFLGLPREAVRNYDELTLAKIVSGLSGERALWMWYLYDEPRPEVLSIETAARVHNLLRRLDPQRPSIILANRDSTAREYSPYCDVLWFDRYPIAATGLEKSSLAPIAEAISTAKKAVPTRKPLWPVLQAQDNSGSPALRKRKPTLKTPNDRTHRPNEAELRAQAHIAIAQKSMAVVYYWAPDSWYSMKTDTPAIWASLSRVLKELRALEPVLLAGESPEPVGLDTPDDNVRMWTRVHEQKLYVGLVNVDMHKPARVVLNAPAANGPFSKVMGDGSFSATSRGLEVRLGPAGVVVVAAGGR